MKFSPLLYHKFSDLSTRRAVRGSNFLREPAARTNPCFQTHAAVRGLRAAPAAIMLKSQLRFIIQVAKRTLLNAASVQLHDFAVKKTVTKEKARTVP